MPHDDPDEPVDHWVPFYWTKVLVSMTAVLLLSGLLYAFRYPVMSTIHRFAAPILGPW